MSHNTFPQSSSSNTNAFFNLPPEEQLELMLAVPDHYIIKTKYCNIFYIKPLGVSIATYSMGTFIREPLTISDLTLTDGRTISSDHQRNIQPMNTWGEPVSFAVLN